MALNAPTVSAPTGNLHLRPGVGFWFNIQPNHTSGEQLNGVELMIGPTDGAVRYTPQTSPFYRLDLALSSSNPYSALVTLPNTIPQNVNLKAWARTYSGGVWSPWGSAGTNLQSPNSNPGMVLTYPIGNIGVSGTVYQPTFQVTVSDSDSDQLAYYQLDVQGADVNYNSGKQPVSQQQPGSIQLYGPPQLSAGVEYTWKVRFWDNAHNAATDADPSYSGTQTFTGEFTVPIGGGGSGAAPYCDTSFTGAPKGQQSVSTTNWTTNFVSRFIDDGAITHYQIQLKRIPDSQLALWQSGQQQSVVLEDIWDSGQVAKSITSGVSFSVPSPQLALNFHYLWRIKVWDADNNDSPYTDYIEFWGASPVSSNVAPIASVLFPTGGVVLWIGSVFLGVRFTDNGATLNSFAHYQVKVRRADNQAIVWQTALIATNAFERSQKSATIAYGSYLGGSAPVALSLGVDYEWQAQVFDDGGLPSGWTPWASFTVRGVTPNAPTNLAPSGLVSTLTPTFSGKFSAYDSSEADTVQILLYGSDQTTVIWDSGSKPASGTNGTAWSVVYDGPTLTPGQILFWKARNRNEFAMWGPYSGLVNIAIMSTPNAPINLAPATTTFEVVPDSDITFAGDHDTVAGNGMDAAEVVLYEDDGTTAIWQSGEKAQTGTRFSVAYTGPALTSGQTVKWKARTRADDTGFWGPFSALQTIHVNRAPLTAINQTPAFTNSSTLTPTLTWSPRLGDSTQHVAGAIDGRRAAFHIIDVKDISDGLSISGYPKNTADGYWDFQTALSGWSFSNATFAAAGGKATVTVAAANGQLYRSFSIYDGWVSAQVKYDASNKSGLLLRRSSATSWMAVVLDAGSVKLLKNNSGSLSTVQSAAVDVSNGQRYCLSALVSGSSYIIYLNGKQVLSTSDAFNATAANHGLYADNTSLTDFDEFFVASPSAETATHTTSALTANHSYLWTVQTHDGFGLGAVSVPVGLTTTTAPTVTITAPANDSTQAAPNVHVTWDYASAGAYAQASYRVVVSLAGSVVYDTSVTSGAAAEIYIPTGYLHNGQTYTVHVTVTDTNGLTTVSSPVQFLALWTPPQSLSSLVLTPSNDEALVGLEWSLSTLSPNDFAYYAVQRTYTQPDGSVSDKIIARLTDQNVTTFTDYVAPEGATIAYSVFQVQSVGVDEVPSGAITAETSLEFIEIWVVDSADPDLRRVKMLEAPTRAFDHVKDEEDVKYWGRTKPVRHKGNADYQSFSVGARLFGDDDDEREAYQTLLAISRENNVICYRDGRGRRLFGNMHLNEQDGLPYNWSVSMQIVESDFNEVV